MATLDPNRYFWEEIDPEAHDLALNMLYPKYAALYNTAMKIAYKQHMGQVDRGGSRYINHPIRVADNCDTARQKVVALLHDVVYILELNQNGIPFVEEFTAILLRKILTPFTTGFVDLQSPAGIINSVIVYNYDGYVYASDESRMLAEQGDYSFRLGKVSASYEKLFYSDKVQQWSQCWGTEFIAGCADCVFQSYCGADPVRNYSTQGDLYGFRPTSQICKRNKAIFTHIFELILNETEKVMPIFKQWALR